MASLEELWSNLTYYKLNTNYNDSMYQYMNNLYAEAAKNFSISRPNTIFGYGLIDGFHIVDNSPTLQYGNKYSNFSCSAPGKEAYVESALSCFFFQLPFFLEKIQFGYICMLLILPILAISFFGGIAESYRWYIINQAIWDLLICYDFICESPTMIGWFSNSFRKQNTCFYFINNLNFYGIFNGIGGGIRDAIHYAPVIPIFLLAFSRFICIYFPFFYKNHFSSSSKNVAFIVVFNLIFLIIICFRRTILTVAEVMRFPNQELCFQRFCSPFQNHTDCYKTNGEYFRCYNQAGILFDSAVAVSKNIANYIAPTLFLLSNAMALLLLLKICIQLKFQLKHNRSMFISTLKIVGVVTFQSITMSIIFVMTFIQAYFIIKATANPNAEVINLSVYDYKSLPGWLFFLQYYSTIASFNVVRVFVDSFIVLTVLGGYYSRVFKGISFLFSCLGKPCFAFRKIKTEIEKKETNRNTVISVSRSSCDHIPKRNSKDYKRVNHC